MRITKSLAEVIADEPFHILVSNFINTVSKLPKDNVVSSSAHSPLPLVSLGGDMGNHVANCLRIVTEDAPKTSSTETLVDLSSTDATRTQQVDWKSQIHLSYLKQEMYQMMPHRKPM